ncbi:hypothetical protein NC653_010776 [Populus alba x Populus x berolinensis]|uniref:Uncharacterized protein n=1 Tax=Populus alba x Populus x berolinensis TaxID=444605 RepID=A0AAD6R0H0_9ROSI|nr:hypothetical protein NC653_010776 [Populus alba x Populus x berolinensis]
MLEEFQVTLLSHVEKSVEVHYGLTSPTLLDIAMNSDIIWLHLLIISKDNSFSHFHISWRVPGFPLSAKATCMLKKT